MTKAQLDDFCRQLISQETVFHKKLGTSRHL